MWSRRSLAYKIIVQHRHCLCPCAPEFRLTRHHNIIESRILDHSSDDFRVNPVDSRRQDSKTRDGGDYRPRALVGGIAPAAKV
jgi:hypothetical protein